MDTRDTTIEENFLIIRIGDRLKTTSSNYHVGKIKLELISLSMYGTKNSVLNSNLRQKQKC